MTTMMMMINPWYLHQNSTVVNHNHFATGALPTVLCWCINRTNHFTTGALQLQPHYYVVFSELFWCSYQGLMMMRAGALGAQR